MLLFAVFYAQGPKYIFFIAGTVCARIPALDNRHVKKSKLFSFLNPVASPFGQSKVNLRVLIALS
jgi:hypothetical protein